MLTRGAAADDRLALDVRRAGATKALLVPQRHETPTTTAAVLILHVT